MKKLDMTEKEKEEDYAERKKEALDFLKLLREMREKKKDRMHYATG